MRARAARGFGLALGLMAGLAVAAGCVLPPAPPPSSTTTTTTPPSPVATPCASSSTAITCETLPVDGLSRRYFFHTSPLPAPAGGRPLVLFFHGDGGTANVNLSSLYAQTDPDAAVVVQLDGPNNIASLNRYGTAWSLYMNGSTPDDVNFTKTVVDGILGGSLPPGAGIDRNRVYAIGSSRGGFMVNTLLVDARTAGYFPGVAVLAGNFYCESDDAVCANREQGSGFGSGASVLHIHGDSDTSVPPPGRLPTPVTDPISWPWPLAQFADAHGCSGDFAYNGQLSPSISGMSTYLYKPAGACPLEYRLVLLKGGGHGFAGWESYTWSFLRAKSRT